MLTRDQLLASTSTFRRERVTIPELGGEVWVRALSGAEVEWWASAAADPALPHVVEETDADGATRRRTVPGRSISALVVSWCVVDEAGRQVFRPGDVDAIQQLPIEVIRPITRACFRLSGMEAPKEPAASEGAEGEDDDEDDGPKPDWDGDVGNR